MKNLEDLLQDALWRGDSVEVRRIESSDPKAFASAVRRQGFRLSTPLFFVARVPTLQGHGDRASSDESRDAERVLLVDLLVDAGADVNARNHRKVTPLHMAARYGLPLVAAALLRRGADANARDVNHETPLYRAANLGQPDVVRVLLENGADAEIPDRLGQRPLDRALAKGASSVVELLAGIGPHARTAGGRRKQAGTTTKRTGNGRKARRGRRRPTRRRLSRLQE